MTPYVGLVSEGKWAIYDAVVKVFDFGGTEIVAVAAAETEDPERSIARAIRTVAWRILVFYIGSLSVIIAVVPWTSEALKSPFAAVLQVANIPGAATAITLIAVIALLSALNANLYGASRMMYSLAQRREAPAVLGWTDPRQVPVIAVLASVLFGFGATVLELLYPNKVLPVLLNVVGSTCLLVWTLSLVSQLVLRRRADRSGLRPVPSTGRRGRQCGAGPHRRGPTPLGPGHARVDLGTVQEGSVSGP